MKKLFTTFFLLIIGYVFSWAQVYTVNVTPNNPEWGEVEIEEEIVETYEGGKLPGVFSVSATKKVAFSQGNLQYQASTGTWRFAEHQYDCIGDANANISSTYTGWIDLFGWGTGDNPTNASENNEDYSTFVDWGENKISNGGNQVNLWRTLTKNEWNYLFNSRTNYDKLWSFATVNGIKGVVLLPDSWSLPSGLSFTAASNNYGTNVYTVAQWAQMEIAGAVFLPAAGYRDGTSLNNVGTSGYFWSSAYFSSYYAYGVYFNAGNLNPSYYTSTATATTGTVSVYVQKLNKRRKERIQLI